MATIFTVHGTFASGPEQGNQWWQRGSEFEQELRENVAADDGQLTFEPVSWDGRNSEASRRRTAGVLAKRLSAAFYGQPKYVLLAHSHGGSVLVNMYLKHVSDGNLRKYLSRVVTVGTPYIEFRKIPWLFNRIGFVAKSTFASLALLAALALTLFLYNAPPLFNVYAFGYVLTLIFGIIPFLVGYTVFRIVDRARFKHYRGSVTSPRQSVLSNRWVCLYDRNDEGIFGLGSLRAMRPKIFPLRFAVPLMSLLSVFIVPAALLTACLSPPLMAKLHTFIRSLSLPGVPLSLRSNGENVFHNLEYLYDLPFKIVQSDRLLPPFDFIAHFVIPPAILFLLSFTATFLVISLSPPLSGLAARILDRVTANAVRRTAYGSDTIGEVAVAAHQKPSWMRKQAQPLPEALSQELNLFCDSAAAKALPRLRALVHDLSFFNANPSKAVEKYLTWNELVHTSYFAIPRFRKLVYYIIANSEGFKPTVAFLSDPDYKLVEQWYQEIEPRG